MRDVIQDPLTPAEGTVAGSSDNISDAVKRSLEFCQTQGISLDAFKFIGIGAEKLRVLPRKSELQLAKCIDDAFTVPDAEAELAKKSPFELMDAGLSMMYKVSLLYLFSFAIFYFMKSCCVCFLFYLFQGAILHRGLRASYEADVKNAALREKSLLEDIENLKKKVEEKEKERDDAVVSYHGMEERGINALARLDDKTGELEKLKVEYEKLDGNFKRLERKIAEKDESFLRKCNHAWELCLGCYDKFGAKSEDPCWKIGDYDNSFGWLCRQYDDLPTVIQSASDLSVVYSTRALFHLMKESGDPLFEKLYADDYKFPPVGELTQVSKRTFVLCEKYFNEYWNCGGREHTFMRAKQRMQKV